jgi:hypothetical protein
VARAVDTEHETEAEGERERAEAIVEQLHGYLLLATLEQAEF